jgi:hypothetical protein
MSIPAIGARPWPEILEHYSNFADRPWGLAVHRLASHLNAKGYVGAGLFGATSMTDLLLGMTTDLGNLPRLRIQPTNANIRLTYEDGSLKPWSIAVDFNNLCDRVERVFLKRARWFRNGKAVIEDNQCLLQKTPLISLSPEDGGEGYERR